MKYCETTGTFGIEVFFGFLLLLGIPIIKIFDDGEYPGVTFSFIIGFSIKRISAKQVTGATTTTTSSRQLINSINNETTSPDNGSVTSQTSSNTIGLRERSINRSHNSIERLWVSNLLKKSTKFPIIVSGASGNSRNVPANRKPPMTTTTRSVQPVNIINIPLPTKPEVQFKPPETIEIPAPSLPNIQLVEQAGIEIHLLPVVSNSSIQIPSLPVVDIVDGSKPLIQIPLFPQITLANPLTSLLPNGLLGIFKPKPNGTSSIFGFFKPNPRPPAAGNKPNKPLLPLYAKIIQAINRIHGKFLNVTGLVTVLPNSTMIQAQIDKVYRVIKIFMMDNPF